jgi:hypothetical protein
MLIRVYEERNGREVSPVMNCRQLCLHLGADLRERVACQPGFFVRSPTGIEYLWVESQSLHWSGSCGIERSRLFRQCRCHGDSQHQNSRNYVQPRVSTEPTDAELVAAARRAAPFSGVRHFLHDPQECGFSAHVIPQPPNVFPERLGQ